METSNLFFLSPAIYSKIGHSVTTLRYCGVAPSSWEMIIHPSVVQKGDLPAADRYNFPCKRKYASHVRP